MFLSWWKYGLKKLLLLIVSLMMSGYATAEPLETEFSDNPMHIVLLIIDGLSYKVWDRMELPNLDKMISGGAVLEKVYLPPAAHPTAGAYADLHSGSIPNPIMMSGTIFIDRDTEYLQECFYPQKTSVFIANALAYETLSYNYHVTHQKSGPNSEAVETALNFMETYEPAFTRLHLQDTGGAGTRSMTIEEDVPWRWNIWADNSPYRIEIARADSLLGVLVNGLDRIGLLKNTTFIICGDHGQADTGWHPPEFLESAITTCVLWGVGVRKNVRISYAELTDIAPTICALMDIRQPSSCIGHAIVEAMKNNSGSIHTTKTCIRDLNHILSEYRQKSIKASWLLENSTSDGKGLLYLRFQREVRENFYSIDRFSDWTDFTSIDSLIAHNRDILKQLDELMQDINAQQ